MAQPRSGHPGHRGEEDTVDAGLEDHERDRTEQDEDSQDRQIDLRRGHRTGCASLDDGFAQEAVGGQHDHSGVDECQHHHRAEALEAPDGCGHVLDVLGGAHVSTSSQDTVHFGPFGHGCGGIDDKSECQDCLLYTSDAADE